MNRYEPTSHENRPDVDALDLDSMAPEALCSLVDIELPNLCPRFGLVPDVLEGPKIEMDEIWERLRRVMDDPVQVFAWRGNKRVVHVLRQWVLVVWTSGRITPLEWKAVGCGYICLRPMEPNELDLFHLGSRSDWYARHRDATRWEHVQAHVAQGGARTAAQPRKRNSQIFTELRHKVLAHVRDSRLDSRIRAGMGLDSGVMHAALSFMGLKRKPCGSEVHIPAYQWVLEHQCELATLRRDAPQLLQWFVACSQDTHFPKEGEPVQRLKRYMAECDVGRQGWLLLLRHGDSLLVEASKRDTDSDTLWKGIEWLKAHRMLGGSDPVPSDLMALIRRHLGDFTWVRYHCASVLAFLVCLWRQNPPQTRDTLREWVEVLEWMAADGVPSRLNAVQRSMRLPHLVRRARKWQRAQERQRLANLKPLYVWHESVGSPRWQLVFLRTRRDLLDEGEAMANCLGHGGPSASYDTLFAKVFEDGEHEGTAFYRFEEGNWHLSDVRGRFNSEWSEERRAPLVALAGLIVRPIFNTGEQT